MPNSQRDRYIYMIFSRSPADLELAKNDNTVPVPEIQYGFYTGEASAKEAVKLFNQRGHVKGQTFYYENIEQMRPINTYLFSATPDWLNPAPEGI